MLARTLVCLVFLFHSILVFASCPDDWTKFPKWKKCLKYAFTGYGGSLNYFTEQCKHVDAKLLDIRSEKELNAFKSFLISSSYGVAGNIDIPTAMHKINGEWTNGDGTKHKHINWANDEPKIHNDCAYIHYGFLKKEFEWKSFKCDGNVMYPTIVCYRDI